MPGSETSPIYGLTIWAGPQAAPWTIQNSIARVMEALGRGSVADRDLADAPATCDDGAAFLIATGTTAADPWDGQAGKLALAVGVNAANGWIFLTIATEGQRLWVADEDVLIQYDGAAWVAVDVGVSALDQLSDVNAPTPADGDVLTWDDVAGEWVADAPAGGGGGDLLSANNLSDLADIPTARTNLSVYSQAEVDAAIIASGSGDLMAANNLSDVANVATARTNLSVYSQAQVDSAIAQSQEWVPNFTADGDVYIAAGEAMTIAQGNAAIGTGTLAFEKSTGAAPGTFAATSLPAVLEAGAWLKVAATGVTDFVATHLVRTA